MELASKEKIVNMSFSLDRYIETENKKGVYFLIKDNEIVYVGQSKNIMNRIYTHKNGNDCLFDRFSFIEFLDSDLRIIKERQYISFFKPLHNSQCLWQSFFTEEEADVHKRHLSIKKIQEIAENFSFNWHTLRRIMYGIVPYDIDIKDRKLMVEQAKKEVYNSVINAYNILFPLGDVLNIEVIDYEILTDKTVK